MLSIAQKKKKIRLRNIDKTSMPAGLLRMPLKLQQQQQQPQPQPQLGGNTGIKVGNMRVKSPTMRIQQSQASQQLIEQPSQIQQPPKIMNAKNRDTFKMKEKVHTVTPTATVTATASMSPIATATNSMSQGKKKRMRKKKNAAGVALTSGNNEISRLQKRESTSQQVIPNPKKGEIFCFI